MPVEPELEDLEVVADLADQSTVLRPAPPKPKPNPKPKPKSPLSDAPTASPLSDAARASPIGEAPTVIRGTPPPAPAGPTPRPPPGASTPPPPPPEEGDAFADMVDGWTGMFLAVVVFGVVVVLALLVLLRFRGTP
jgi:hypothetical protein